MKPMPIRYVRDMDQARTFYEALGLTLDFISRKPRRGPSPVWAELSGSGGGLALHYVPEGLLLQINENDHELQRLPGSPGHGADQGLRLHQSARRRELRGRPG